MFEEKLRIEDEEEIADLGIDDYLSNNAICVVEWADKSWSYIHGH